MQNNINATKPQREVLFELGNIYITPAARRALAESRQHPVIFLAKHHHGDWGIVSKEDQRENDLSVKNGFRILSAYLTTKGEKLWIITEADRSSTTILLPEDY